MRRLRPAATTPGNEYSHHRKERTEMKRAVIRVFRILWIGVVIASPAFSQTAKTSAPSGKPIKLGGSLPLTGIFSESAKWVKAGYEFWAEDINKRGGLPGRARITVRK
jgi:branched-chain amino acid transport system substrate-binding protein